MSNFLHFIFATLLFSHISRCAADSSSSICKNDSTFKFIREGTTRGCGWIRKQSDDIRQGVCQNSDIRSQCKVSCGICCEDDPDYFFVINDHPRYCPWFGKKPIRINTYCGRKSYLNGAQVRNVCPKACNNCPSFISLETNPAFQIGSAPTPAPRPVSTPVPPTPPATKPIPSLAPTPALNLPLSPAPTPDPNLSVTPAPRNPRSPTMIPTTRAPVLIPDQDSTSKNPAPHQNNLGSVIDGPPDDRDKKSFPYVAVFTSIGGGVLCLSLSIIAAFVIWKRRSNNDDASTSTSKRKLKLPRLFRRRG